MDNRRRDRLYGKPEPEATVDTSEWADKVRTRTPSFPYTCFEK